MARLVVHVFLIASVLAVTYSWKVSNLPRLYGDRVPQQLISTRVRRVQRRIVMLHDFFRTKVEPPASNMLSMKWHRGAARVAQKWADECRFLTHDSPQNRAVSNFGQCGQNIFVSTHKVPWLFALRSWFVEHNNFTYGSPYNDPSVVGHYTQMVWASTHKVGCGLTKCFAGPHGKPFYNYVCNYCPAGNYPHLLPVPYKAGAPCSSCPHSCRSDKVKLCTNSCNTDDGWSNCRELSRKSPSWVCSPPQYQHCRATCSCRGRIYD